MNYKVFFNGLCYSLLFSVLSFVTHSVANCEDLSSFKSIVISRIKLINHIIDDPKAANMKNWGILGNPHDESELKFFIDSISDGTLSAYDDKKDTMKKLVKHSQSITADEPSVLLQYLRLSLMAYNIRPGAISPSLQLVSISQLSQNQIVAKCTFHLLDASGDTVAKDAEVFFDIGDNSKDDLFLYKIIVDGRAAYGGW